MLKVLNKVKFNGVKVEVSLAKYDKYSNKLTPCIQPTTTKTEKKTETQSYIISKPLIQVNKDRSFKEALAGRSDSVKKVTELNHKSVWFPETQRMKAVIAEASNFAGLLNAK